MRKQNRQIHSRAAGAAAGSTEHEQRDRWLLSYADLVTLLLALFIVLFAASDQERAKRIVQSFGNLSVDHAAAGDGVLPGSSDLLAAEQAKIETALSEHPRFAQGAKLRRVTGGFVVSLAEAGFFNSGEANIDPQAAPLFDALADSLRESNATIRVEGHTDSTPISTARFPSNWELSAARATVVLSRLIERGIRPARLSAAGYGGEQPVADNATAEGRAQNRRVDLVVLNK
jgi:chemotaxis protein MotB